jgi:hypothetical protein
MNWTDYSTESRSDNGYRVYWLNNIVGPGGQWCIRTPRDVPLKATYATREVAKAVAEEHYETLRSLM